MGIHLCKADDKNTTYRLLVKGHGDEDKTKLFQTLKLKQKKERPRHGLAEYDFKMMKISLGGVHVECWDLGDAENMPKGGRCSVRFEYHVLFRRIDGIVYVIDSTASEKLDEALEEIEKDILCRWSTDNGADIPLDKVLMILAIKQDVKGALPLQMIQEKAKKVVTCNSDTLEERCLFVAGCNEDQEGLEEAMTLLKDQIRLRREGKMKTGFIYLSSLQEEKRKEREADSKNFLKKIANILSY